MASRKRKLEVEETSPEEESKGPSIHFEEACILVTTVALLAGIVVIFLMLGQRFGAGPFA